MRASGNWQGLGAWLMLMVALTAGAARGEAQTPDVGAAEVSAENFLSLVPSRDTAEIRRDIEAAAQRQTVATNNLEQTEKWRTSAKLRVDDMKRRIDGINDRVKIAKNEKQEADRLRLEAEKKAAEREQQLLERRQSLREAEIDLLKKQGERAALDQKALELEMQLVMKRDDPARPAAGTVERASFDQIVAELERKTLEAQRSAAAKSSDVANQEKSVVERRMAILDAQRSVVGGK